ncbi:hypothetical protein ACIGFK_07480 [Streptomyces sp. NPDC085524]|uniref:hypothetical protein n=1 Tax=unclassified Streptomyces TaxID=2593676 RepID=UPI0035D56BE3
MTTPTLPVRLTVGDHTVDIGTVALAPGERLLTHLAALFRTAADACETRTGAQTEEDTTHGTA